MVPLVILILMVSIQAALWFHASNVARAAAGEGASAAAAANITSVEAEQRGARAAEDLSSEARVSLAGTPSVIVAAREVRITVSAVVPRIVPFFPTVVDRTVIEPREVITLEADR
jgi:TadE-like protein